MKRFVAWMQGVRGRVGRTRACSSSASSTRRSSRSRSQRPADHRHGDAAPAPPALYYALMATLGSVLGCLALYYVARKGGEAFLREALQGASRRRRRCGCSRNTACSSSSSRRCCRRRRRSRSSSCSPASAAIPVWQFAAADLHRALHPLLRRRAAGGLVRRGGGALHHGPRQGSRPVAGRASAPGSSGCAWIAWKTSKARIINRLPRNGSRDLRRHSDAERVAERRAALPRTDGEPDAVRPLVRDR